MSAVFINLTISLTEYTKLINLPKIGTNRALILSLKEVSDAVAAWRK